jgi:flagellar protein FlaG
MNVNTLTSAKDAAGSGQGMVETGIAREVKTAALIQEKAAEKKATEAAPITEIKELADTLNDYMDDLQTNLGFFIHEELNHQVIVEIKNRETDELVKQIPSEEMVAIREKMAELTGLLLDKSV